MSKKSDTTGGVIMGIISIVIIFLVLADTEIAAAIPPLPALLLSFVGLAYAAAMVRKAFQS